MKVKTEEFKKDLPSDLSSEETIVHQCREIRRMKVNYTKKCDENKQLTQEIEDKYGENKQLTQEIEIKTRKFLDYWKR